MARKGGRRSAGNPDETPRKPSLARVYPTIHRWASGYKWVESGINSRDRPSVRALDDGGEVREGTGRHQALAAMEEGQKEFMRGAGFDACGCPTSTGTWVHESARVSGR
jgi:hypothetical protein